MHREPAAQIEDRDHAHARAATLLVVLEYASGGGLAGELRRGPLLREGLAMRDALLADAGRVRGLRVRVPVDDRLPAPRGTGARAVPIPPGELEEAAARLAEDGGRVWLIAPESGGRLERLARRVEDAGGRLVGPGAAAIRAAADKRALASRLAAAGVPTPAVWPAGRAAEAVRTAGFPLVVKPSPGCGCEGVALAADRRRLRAAIRRARRLGGEPIVQAYVAGRAASAALLVADGRVLPLALSGQQVTAGARFAYHGGVTPLAHPLAAAALDAARRACESLPGLRGLVGVDLILARSGPVVIEVNPRPTTSCVGVRAATGANLVRLALAAADGELPRRPPRAARTVRFRSDGRLLPA